jgi:CRP/FNR family cyclic AMP-dependent transcriptional regulator
LKRANPFKFIEEGEAGMSPTEEIYDELIKIPWFQALKPEHIQQVAEISTLRHFKAGEVFFREGDKQDYFYIVLSGRVALDMFIPHRGKVRFYTCEEWDNFGWSAVTPFVRTRTAGAVAVMEGVVISTDVEKLSNLCERDHDFGYIFMRRMSNVIASRLMVTRLQLLDMFSEPPREAKNDE